MPSLENWGGQRLCMYNHVAHLAMTGNRSSRFFFLTCSWSRQNSITSTTSSSCNDTWNKHKQTNKQTINTHTCTNKQQNVNNNSMV